MPVQYKIDRTSNISPDIDEFNQINTFPIPSPSISYYRDDLLGRRFPLAWKNSPCDPYGDLKPYEAQNLATRILRVSKQVSAEALPHLYKHVLQFGKEVMLEEFLKQIGDNVSHPRHIELRRCIIGEPPSLLDGKAWESHQGK